MKLTEKQIEELNCTALSEDWEKYHCLIDDLMKTRLEELDGEFMNDVLEHISKNDATLWYA